MPDKIFSSPQLAQIYDAFDGDRGDLVHYLNIAKEFKARNILDIGCGTGCFALLLADNGFKVTAIDPAAASLDMALKKQGAESVHFLCGTSADLPQMDADMAFMTGNVAQVFLNDDDFISTLKDIHAALSANGILVFEVRDPAQKAWEQWTKENSYTKINVDDIGLVEGWNRIDKVDLPYIHFTWTYNFEETDETYESVSILRFRSKDEITKCLEKAGYKVLEVRDAPDRPQLEFVFVAQKI